MNKPLTWGELKDLAVEQNWLDTDELFGTDVAFNAFPIDAEDFCHEAETGMINIDIC